MVRRTYDDIRTINERVMPSDSRNIPASAPTDRKTRRALVKALGNRQFKNFTERLKHEQHRRNPRRTRPTLR